MEYIFRGNAYIDGIAKTFEARNYLSLVVSFVTSLTMTLAPNNILWLNALYGVSAGLAVFLLIRRFSKGKTVGDIANVSLGKITVKNSDLYVDDMFVTNFLGTDTAKDLVQNQGIEAVIYPREEILRLTLDKYRVQNGNPLILIAKNIEDQKQLSLDIARTLKADVVELHCGDYMVVR